MTVRRPFHHVGGCMWAVPRHHPPGAPTGTRTLTGPILSRLPLPVGLWGPEEILRPALSGPAPLSPARAVRPGAAGPGPAVRPGPAGPDPAEPGAAGHCAATRHASRSVAAAPTTGRRLSGDSPVLPRTAGQVC